MSDASGLLVASVDTDEADITVDDPLTQRLVGCGHAIERHSASLRSVTNPHYGEDKEPSTYFVQTIVVHGQPDSDVLEPVRTCTCKAFKFHESPPMGSFDTTDADELVRAIGEVGECKHCVAVRRSERSEETRPAEQDTLGDFGGGGSTEAQTL